MTKSPFEDLPSVQKVLKDFQSIEQFRRAWPMLKPLLRAMGVDVGKAEAALLQAISEREKVQSSLMAAGRFNDLFTSRGWIVYDMLNRDVTVAAVTRAEAGDIAGAEQDLVEYFSPETVRLQLMMMHGIRAFRPRMELAKKALTDYAESRYYACVPVVLSLLDGLVYDLANNRGFFVDGANLAAWDSFAAHNGKLAELARLLGSTRGRTRTEQIEVPFRNGILHGRDLGYDNKTVAAKAWAALFAVADWARKMEAGNTPPPEEPPKGIVESIREMARQVAEHAKDKADHEAHMSAFAERHLVVGVDIPASGEPEAYGEGTPERRLAEFFAWWRERRYDRMGEMMSFMDKKYAGKTPAANMSERFRKKQLASFAMVEVVDESPAISQITARVVYTEEGQEIEKTYAFRLVYEDAAGAALVRGRQLGAWVLYTYFV